MSVTPLTAGPVTALLFTVTGLQVGNTVVRIDFTGTSPPCTNTGSRFLTVHVIERPVIIQQPTSQSVAAGTDVTFTVVATGNLLRYQWRLNGVNLLGATSDTLTVANVQPTNAGDYSVAVYNAAGVVNSDSAKLTVTNISTLPFADNFDGPGNNISDPDHKYATAIYNFGFATTILTFQLVDPDTIILDDSDKFNDGSGRQNYHSREVFRKLIIRPLPFVIP